MVIEPVDDAIAKSTPEPLNATICGPPAALSDMTTVPARLPLAEGIKVTLMLQLAPAFKEAPQLFLCAKSPVAVMDPRASGAFPILPSRMLCAAL
jgi:hypothetical protein